ncbi:CDP-glycerol glycerophosphotransferase family protein [Bifidobacterium amazonense]|uniref:CDP-glycerol glycerophosphotransferase family protein n=1 Tax=Bifidobacterium amazonense TaxID=2809027 RepID=A0ABS9VTU4_9BIFI|nr:CDP-glycerol glycerophosphotransferase family protein [Bifidobacterium amazonense]MCH9275499.1 CDP-glycerol glycerophosphotransferase family protein [Bifidobacterium amazonense]
MMMSKSAARLAIGGFRLTLLALYRMFRHLPRHRRIVCLSRESDTAPIDFELVADYVVSHHPGYSVRILARKLRNPVTYAAHMVRQLYYIATSEAVLLDTYAIAVSLLAGHIDVPVVQMWHALGNMKKFGYTAIGNGEGRDRTMASLMNMHKGYTSLLISSKSFITDYAAGFGVSPSIIHEAPLPRTDLLLDRAYRTRRRESIMRRFPQLQGKRNIVYCPTFRKRTPVNQSQAMHALVDAIDFGRYNLIVKTHPLDDLHFDDPRVIQDYPDSYDMLFAADYVISDYSTVIYEAGLLDLPVFLYGYDWKEYSSRRSLYIDPRRDIPTLFTADAGEIMDAIAHDRFNRAAYRTFIRRNVAVPSHGSCTQRVVEHVFDLMNRSQRSE